MCCVGLDRIRRTHFGGSPIGQVIAVHHGPLPALTYYLCVAPLSYFHIWSFGTWEPERVCGVIYIVGAWLLYYPEPDAPRFRKNPLMLLTVYCVLATLVGVLFWPMDSIEIEVWSTDRSVQPSRFSTGSL